MAYLLCKTSIIIEKNKKCDNLMHILVGSLNPVKIQAVHQAFMRFFPFKSLFVEGRKVSSEISNQPIGLDQILKGAGNRAINIQRIYQKEFPQSSTEPRFYVGIEAGFVRISENKYLDFQFCSIINDLGENGIGSGSGLSFPEKVIEHLLSNRNMELGDIMASMTGNAQIKYQEGAIGYFSHDLIKRIDITQQSVEMALIPFLNKGLYFSKA